MNRGTFPWGKEDEALQEWYRTLGRLRDQRPSLRQGGLRWIRAEGHVLAFAREWKDEITVAVVNVGDEPDSLLLAWPGKQALDALSGNQFTTASRQLDIWLPPLTGILLV